MVQDASDQWQNINASKLTRPDEFSFTQTLACDKTFTCDFFLCFFLENEEHCPRAVSAETDVMRFPKRDVSTKINSFHVSLFPLPYIYVVCLISCCVWPPLPLSSPLPLHPHPLSFHVFMDESCLNYYWPFVLNISVVAFSEECKALPCAVSVKEDARRFFKKRRWRTAAFG